jgi:protein SCO1/2
MLLPPMLAVFVTAWLQLHSGHSNPPLGYGTARIGGHFALTDSSGKAVTDENFRGKPMLVYLGFSNCPDMCPMTLTTMADTLKALGTDASKITFIFITLDPEHDSPSVLRDYLAHFDARIVGLTGSKEAVEQVAKDYKAVATKTNVPATGKTLINHSGYIYLMDAKGTYVTHFEGNAKPAEMAAAIRKVI